MRGKVVSERRRKVSSGITPAYAGKSYFHGSSQRKNQDHPRLCGEKIRYMLEQAGISGSPPPMRGKDSEESQNSTVFGITPAYAGKSSRTKNQRISQRDHPRLCGEKMQCVSFVCFRAGSPPPMRGKAFDFRHTVKEIGITPAYAGKRQGKC